MLSIIDVLTIILAITLFGNQEGTLDSNMYGALIRL